MRARGFKGCPTNRSVSYNEKTKKEGKATVMPLDESNAEGDKEGASGCGPAAGRTAEKRKRVEVQSLTCVREKDELTKKQKEPRPNTL